MHVLRRVPAVAALVSSALMAGAVGACASGGGIFPTAGDPNAAVANAERLIAEAQQAGADSLVPDAMASARQNFAAAQVLMRQRSLDRAALKGREAAADATYARAAALRATAERERAAAQAALNAVGGNP
jgi:hypothetical protein